MGWQSMSVSPFFSSSRRVELKRIESKRSDDSKDLEKRTEQKHVKKFKDEIEDKTKKPGDLRHVLQELMTEINHMKQVIDRVKLDDRPHSALNQGPVTEAEKTLEEYKKLFKDLVTRTLKLNEESMKFNPKDSKTVRDRKLERIGDTKLDYKALKEYFGSDTHMTEFARDMIFETQFASLQTTVTQATQKNIEKINTIADNNNFDRGKDLARIERGRLGIKDIKPGKKGVDWVVTDYASTFDKKMKAVDDRLARVEGMKVTGTNSVNFKENNRTAERILKKLDNRKVTLFRERVEFEVENQKAFLDAKLKYDAGLFAVQSGAVGTGEKGLDAIDKRIEKLTHLKTDMEFYIRTGESNQNESLGTKTTKLDDLIKGLKERKKEILDYQLRTLKTEDKRSMKRRGGALFSTSISSTPGKWSGDPEKRARKANRRIDDYYNLRSKFKGLEITKDITEEEFNAKETEIEQQIQELGSQEREILEKRKGGVDAQRISDERSINNKGGYKVPVFTIPLAENPNWVTGSPLKRAKKVDEILEEKYRPIRDDIKDRKLEGTEKAKMSLKVDDAVTTLRRQKVKILTNGYEKVKDKPKKEETKGKIVDALKEHCEDRCKDVNLFFKQNHIENETDFDTLSRDEQLLRKQECQKWLDDLSALPGLFNAGQPLAGNNELEIQINALIRKLTNKVNEYNQQLYPKLPSSGAAGSPSPSPSPSLSPSPEEIKKEKIKKEREESWVDFLDFPSGITDKTDLEQKINEEYISLSEDQKSKPFTMTRTWPENSGKPSEFYVIHKKGRRFEVKKYDSQAEADSAKQQIQATLSA